MSEFLNNYKHLPFHQNKKTWCNLVKVSNPYEVHNAYNFFKNKKNQFYYYHIHMYIKTHEVLPRNIIDIINIKDQWIIQWKQWENVYFILNRNKRIDVFSEKRMDKS